MPRPGTEPDFIRPRHQTDGILSSREDDDAVEVDLWVVLVAMFLMQAKTARAQFNPHRPPIDVLEGDVVLADVEDGEVKVNDEQREASDGFSLLPTLRAHALAMRGHACAHIHAVRAASLFHARAHEHIRMQRVICTHTCIHAPCMHDSREHTNRHTNARANYGTSAHVPNMNAQGFHVFILIYSVPLVTLHFSRNLPQSLFCYL